MNYQCLCTRKASSKILTWLIVVVKLYTNMSYQVSYVGFRKERSTHQLSVSIKLYYLTLRKEPKFK